MSKELEALESLKTALHNEWLRFYPQFKELDEKTKLVDGVRMVSSDAEAFTNVKQALQRLEAIDNANPNEALECLEWLTSSLIGKYKLFYEEGNINEKTYKESIECIKDDYETVKQALLKAQEQEKFLDDKLVFKNGCMMSGFDYKEKQIVAMPLEEYDRFMNQEKALEIIKEKNVAVAMLKSCMVVTAYNIIAFDYEYLKDKNYARKLTEEEFNLLKEVLV